MKNERRFYTYAYLREDGKPYYIGKGSGNRAFSKNGRKISLPPKERILILKKNLTEGEAFKHEIYMIAVFGRKDLGTGILYNFTDGGEGPSNLSEERLEKLRERMRGNKINVGRKPSEETLRKRREKMKGRKPTELNRKRLREAHLGSKRTEETRRNISVKKMKPIEIVFPSGRVGVFKSRNDAVFYTGINFETMRRLLKGTATTFVERGYSARYL
jgi:hypothetical protein